ncbi:MULTISPECIES: hypothetical protein [unclassified Ruegeria]|uniref:hypothetical protein n=1 Tax=unclassified Ruegeria TaxID=2625375 RepID=UPI0014886C2D|nr:MULTISPECIES: hypothetical protein [unclassified Ruegeria]
MSYRRRHTEVFSLSMLDTVTCGLGGAIVIMLYMASEVPKQAKLIFEQLEPSDQPGEQSLTPAESHGQTAPNFIGLLTLFFSQAGGQEFDLAMEHERPTAKHCQATSNDFFFALGHTADILFTSSFNSREVSLSVWAERGSGQERPDCVVITPPTAVSCEYTYVTDGYATIGRPEACPTEIKFILSDDGQTYKRIGR